MTDTNKSAIVVSASSDIGGAISSRWAARGSTVLGTYRTRSKAVDDLEEQGVRLLPCDLSDSGSITETCSQLRMLCPEWDILVVCPGTLEPVGAFAACDFDKWEESIKVNFTAQLRMVHELLPARRGDSPHGPCVLLFAGSGTNSAPVNYSAYSVAKVALIKMCELLDAEIPDTRFVILGPGVVRTKIHEQTVRAGARAGDNRQRVMDRLAASEDTPMERVVDCCDWLVDSPREIAGGRNFSLVYDLWGTEELDHRLIQDPNMYKLRRSGNDWKAKTRP